MKPKTTKQKLSVSPPTITKSEIEAEYAKLFHRDTERLPGEKTVTEFCREYGYGFEQMQAKLEGYVKAGMMTRREIYINGKPRQVYGMAIQQNDNNAKVIVSKGRKR